MKTETITANELYENWERYPERVELWVNGDFLAIDHIANHQIINGSWLSDGLTIYIECDWRNLEFQLGDEVTIRYRNPNIIDCLPNPYPAPLGRNDK